ncbi:hypothetical protein [Methanocalculus chunghsingensis]|uniref:hypothetical protein n=1 Tax=Methanocalculus chunghsingensis TaxID=156457 RepID=UPI001B8D2F8D|nr:hypothetical protein [Methanocalculus chunghsingensis]
MCTVGGAHDVEMEEDRVKGKDYRCRDCNATFKAVGKHPICPTCQSDNLTEA